MLRLIDKPRGALASHVTPDADAAVDACVQVVVRHGLFVTATVSPSQIKHRRIAGVAGERSSFD